MTSGRRPDPREFSPGQIISLEAETDLSDHVHRAIVRNATEMITANKSGMVEVLAIPWDLFGRQR